MQINTEIGYDSKIEGDVIVTRRDAALNWFRKNSLWPMPMGLACCAIELMAAGASRFDISRFGSEVMRFSPRQSDVMIVAGTVTYKMAMAVRRIYEQMPEPKWVIAMGACASTGGMYRSYAVLQGVDLIVPVDVYVAGCPPRPEALLDGLLKLQAKVAKEPFAGVPKEVTVLEHAMTALELVQKLKDRFGSVLGEPSEFRGEITLDVLDADQITGVCAFARKELGFDFLVDISSVGNYGDDPRFTLVYELYGHGHRCHVRLKTA